MLIQSQRDGHRKTKLEGIAVSTSTCSRTEWDNGPKFLETHVHRLWAFLPVCRVLFYDCVTFDLFLECRKRIEFFFFNQKFKQFEKQTRPLCTKELLHPVMYKYRKTHTHTETLALVFSQPPLALFSGYTRIRDSIPADSWCVLPPPLQKSFIHPPFFLSLFPTDI